MRGLGELLRIAGACALVTSLVCVVPGCGAGEGTSMVGDVGAGGADARDEASLPADDVTVTPDGDGKDAVHDTAGALCVSGLDCDDGQRCTDQVCLEGRCVVTPNALTCDDADPCTEGDVCRQGVCVGTPRVCDDGNPCTVDRCEAGACAVRAEAGEACALTIEVEAPELGAFVTADGQAPRVRGVVRSPAGPLVTVRVDGVGVPHDEGRFDAPSDALAGLNIVRLQAEDSLGRQVHTQRAFLYSDGWRPVGTPEAPVPVPLALRAWARADVFDDDQPDLDDLAGVIRHVLARLDLAAHIPHPLTAEGEGPSLVWCTWTVDVTDLRFQVGEIDLKPVAGGMRLAVDLYGLEADVEAVAPWCPDALGTVRAAHVALDVAFLVDVDGGGRLSVSTAWVDATVQDVSVDLTGGAASLIDWLVDWFEGSFDQTIEDALESWIPDQLVPLLDEALNAYTSYDRAFSLPAVPGNPPHQPLLASLRVGSALFGSDGARVTIEAAVAAPDVLGADTPGSFRRGDCLGASSAVGALPETEAVEVWIGEDLINQALHALWAGGHATFTLPPEVLAGALGDLPVSDVTLSVTPALPPLLTSCREAGSLEAQIGDLRVDASFALNGKPGSLTLRASLRVAARPVVEVGEDGRPGIGLVIEGVREVTREVLASEGTGDLAATLAAGFLNAAALDGLLLGTVSDAIHAFPVPGIDLTTWLPELPAGSVLVIEPVNASVEPGGGVRLSARPVAP